MRFSRWAANSNPLPRNGTALPKTLPLPRIANGRKASSIANDSGNATDAPQPGLTVTSVFEAYPGLSAVRTHTRLRSPEPFSVEAVSSMNLTVPLTVNGGTVESSHLLWGGRGLGRGERLAYAAAS